MTTVQGEIAPGFEPVRDILENQFQAGQHVGAAVAVYLGGKPVVDLWGGLADKDAGTRWQRDTLSFSYSTTKGLTAACLHLLADRGRVSYDDPVAKHWPEFAANGKESVTVYHLLTHQAGVPQVPDAVTRTSQFADWDFMVRELAKETPMWTPGEGTGYHAMTFGWLVGEVVRRIDGRSLGTFLREEIAGPLGLRDMHIGAPEDAEPRIAKMTSMLPRDEASRGAAEAFLAANPVTARAIRRLDDGDYEAGLAFLNSRAGHAAEIPAINGVMTARDLARMYACLANYGELDGVRLMSADRVRTMSERQTHRPDKTLIIPIGWSLGYMNGGDPGWPQGTRTTAFGHPGAGGSVGFADPEIGMSFGLTLNGLQTDWVGTGRAAALAEAARASAAAVSDA